jgi:hypothetical protein
LNKLPINEKIIESVVREHAHSLHTEKTMKKVQILLILESFSKTGFSLERNQKFTYREQLETKKKFFNNYSMLLTSHLKTVWKRKEKL